MKNPYDVLGVSRFASEAEIKNAYKKLSAKYYSASDSVSLKKMEELNCAYDEIMSKKKSGDTVSKQAPVSEFSDVRKLITSGRLSDAEELLDSVRSLARGGEWNYLKALVLSKRGFIREASAYIERALEKDRFSDEFNELYKSLTGSKASEKGGLSDLVSMLGKLFDKNSGGR